MNKTRTDELLEELQNPKNLDGFELAGVVTYGENPPLTQPQKDEILTAHRIHCGKVSRCSICGHDLPKAKGCHACPNCGSNVGACGQ